MVAAAASAAVAPTARTDAATTVADKTSKGRDSRRLDRWRTFSGTSQKNHQQEDKSWQRRASGRWGRREAGVARRRRVGGAKTEAFEVISTHTAGWSAFPTSGPEKTKLNSF